MKLDLKRLVVAARLSGWAVARGDIAEVESSITRFGWTVTPNRKDGQQAVETIRPASLLQARRASMSARTGTGRQPLHTDGAHHVNPPEFVALSVERETEVPTRLLSLLYSPRGIRKNIMQHGDTTKLRNGLFLVKSGDDSFLTPALTDFGKFRYDPICMFPQDQRALDSAALIASLDDRAVDHQWTTGTVLLIANWFVLHGRGDAARDTARAMKRIAFTPSADFSLEVEQP